jgi:serralysin
MAINGTNGKDFFRGTVFDDEINGAGGDDFFHGSPGQDELNGQSGADSVDYSMFRYGPQFYNTVRGDSVDVDLQRATQIGGLADGDSLVSIENVAGSIENDVIRGDANANTLVGNGGDDVLEGRDGDDVLIGEGSGDDIGADETFFVDSPGNDVLDGGAGNDQLFGGGGNDTLTGGTGVNKLDGGTGTDTASYATSTAGVLVSLTAGNGNGVALGLGPNSGSDQLISIENITGSGFADTITGSSAANVIDGGAGDDVISGGAGADTLKGNSGVDTASYGGSSAGVNVNLGTLSVVSNGQGGFTFIQVGGTGTGGDAQGDTLNGFENLIGSAFADTLTGNNGVNRLEGGAGDDVISGGGGNDTIIGGSDVDIENLSGGAGFDTFVYLSRSDSNTSAVRTGDFITDFNVDQDLIDLRALGVNAANLLITNNVVNGTHFARVVEDLNANGQADDNELSINLIVVSAADLTLQDILI